MGTPKGKWGKEGRIRRRSGRVKGEVVRRERELT